MELRHLRYFVAVAEEGSLTRASLRLGIQQPPLGSQIRALEEEIGVPLFDREPKKINLNAAGRRFLEEARDILARSSHAIDDIRRFDKGERGRIKVGFASSTSLHELTPPILASFRKAYPFASIDIDEHETYALILALQGHQIDVAFLHTPVETFTDLTSRTIDRKDMVVALPIDHRLARMDVPALDLDMLADEDFVVYRRADGPGIFDSILSQIEARGTRIRIAYEVNRIVAAINMVSAGAGISIVPSTLEVLHTSYVKYVPVAETFLRPIGLNICWRRAEKLALVHNFVAEAVRTAQAQ